MLKKVLSLLMCFVLFFSVQSNVYNCVSNDEYQIKYLFMQRLNDDLSRYYEVITDGERVYINIDDLVEIANYDSSTVTTQNGKLSKILINKKNYENTSFDNSIQILPNKKIITSSWYGENNFDGIVDFNSKIYLDIIDIFNYLRIKAEIVDGKILVNIPVYSMLDFLIYDYQDVLNNFITQMDLKTYGDGENGSNFMNTIAVAVNNFNFKFLIPVWGPMELKKEQYIKAIQTLSEEDEEFYSPTTNGYMENQLEEKGFSKLLSSGEDLVNGMSIGGETINTYETFIDSLTNISEEQRGKYLDLVNWNGKNYDAFMDLRVWNKYAENLSNVIDISDIFVSAYEAYTRANSWTESNLKDLEILKNLNINNYADKKEYVNRITDAASECYESANNKAEAVVKEIFEKTMELLFEKAVGVTPVGKVANYFVLAVNTGVSAAKTFPNISNKLDKAELSYIVTCLINVAIAAKIDANVKYENFSLENLSSNDIVEFRDSIRTAIKCNLRSWYYIYYLNKDGSWEYGSEGQEVKNKINMMNTYLILLNECIQYDYSLDEYNIINFSSTEIITILNDSKVYDNLVVDAYSYEYENEEGEFKYKIPKINLSGDNFSKINDEIYEIYSSNDGYDDIETYVEDIENGEYPHVYEIDYNWGINDSVLSIVIEHKLSNNGLTSYDVYNLDINDGSEISNSQVVAMSGFSVDEYDEKTKQAVGSYFWNNLTYNGIFENEFGVTSFNDSLKRSLSSEYIDRRTPYFNDNQELCIVVAYRPLAGSDTDFISLNLENFELVPDYDKEAELSYVNNTTESVANTMLSQDDAYQIACDYWDYQPGDTAGEDNKELAVVYDSINTGKDGREYYLFVLKWYVNGSSSAVDYVYIDMENGSCKMSIQ